MIRVFSSINEPEIINSIELDKIELEIDGSWWLKGIKQASLLKKDVIVRTHYIWDNNKKHNLKSMYVFIVRYTHTLCRKPKKFKCQVYNINYNKNTSNVIEEYFREQYTNNDIMINISKEMLIYFLIKHQQYLRDEINISI